MATFSEDRVKEIIAKAHAKGIPVLVDGAQAVPHLRVDVRDLDSDFYVFSGHKLSGPTGIGALYDGFVVTLHVMAEKLSFQAVGVGRALGAQFMTFRMASSSGQGDTRKE